MGGGESGSVSVPYSLYLDWPEQGFRLPYRRCMVQMGFRVEDKFITLFIFTVHEHCVHVDDVRCKHTDSSKVISFEPGG